ncbi:PREDICTED: uncharacterized protein LOC108558637 [Nicrophorus vespilloides]|uniref:Uncharacterized protein LOC108558637 n=1 Tax=Nicrophorus vespilloides TaxID=110193 RepID=A0ABM1M955_NICVS|nr:PREDICTED: uncharacterized protein LOC108558637 [Nicrophorus vespilloides]
MSNYPGMSLGSEIRESISLDEDDMSDVEDEVFIRDGKNGYKFAEDIGVKRPLMAPRRKLTKPDFKTRLKNRPPCRKMCKPFCFVIGTLLAIIGLITLIVVIVSMFPLPIDKIKDWIVTKAQKNVTMKMLPCSDLKVTDVWAVTLPKLTSDSSIRTLDVNGDGVEDLIFGFGTGDNSVLHHEVFCPMFLGIASPCGGGVIALDGKNGSTLWRNHLPHAIFTLFCSADVNGDGIFDCLATGKGGIFITINSRDGTTIWVFQNKDEDVNLIMDIYAANFIPDQDSDKVMDILASHTMQKDRQRTGQLLVISGKTGNEIQRMSTPYNAETYSVPQLLPKPDDYYVLFGTGSPSSPGNLSVISLKSFMSGNASFVTIYEDKFKGILSPSVMYDINGDGQLDVISAMFNSTVIAFDGNSFKQIWSFTVNNSETLSVPTPGFFNDDNVVDFLIKYQTGPEFPVYYYSQVYILDGKTGKVIYDRAIVDSVGSQMGGLTMGMEGPGNDFFLYWLADCDKYEGKQDIYEFLPGSTLKEQSNSDICKLRFNSTKVTKLYALNQYDQPPGIEIYNSGNRTSLEYNNTKSAMEEATEYLKKHPEVQTGEVEETFKQAPEPPKQIVYKDNSPFRHKDNNLGLIKDYNKPEHPKLSANPPEQKFEPDYDQQPEMWQPKVAYPQNYQPDEIDYTSYLDDAEPMNAYGKQYMEDNAAKGNRDTRGDEDTTRTTKKLADKRYGVYDYRNIEQSKNRLLHNLNELPTDILKDTYLKNMEQQLRKSRFEQRDLQSHIDKMKENAEVKRVLDEEKEKMLNVSENLWTLESEKEAEDRKNGLWRVKREASSVIKGIPRITSVGSQVKPLVPNTNAIDLVFLTYWTPPKDGPQLLVQKDYECITEKIKKALNSKEEILNYEKAALEELFKKECLTDRGVPLNVHPISPKPYTRPKFPYANEIAQLNLGQMTVYRIRVECVCEVRRGNERCAKFINPEEGHGWASYMGKTGSGIFQ